MSDRASSSTDSPVSFKPAPRKPIKPPSKKPTHVSESDSDDDMPQASGKRPVVSHASAAAPPAKKPTNGLAASLATGKPPLGVTVNRPRLGETANAKTARYIRSLMDKHRPTLDHTIKQDTDAFNQDIEMPDWRDADGKHSSTALRNIDELINSDADFIPYKNFSIMQHHENQLSMLGGVPTTGEVQHDPFFRLSNKERVTFDYLYENLEKIIDPVIRETDSFALRPMQRLVIGAWLQRYPLEIHARVRRKHELPAHANQAGIPPNTRPSLGLVNLGPGNGKTIIGITMAMTELCNPTLWANLKRTWRETIWAKSSMNHIGLTKSPHLTEQVLARVTIAFIPSPLMKQWERTAKLVNEAMCTEFGYGFTIWTGLQVLQRAGFGDDGQPTIRKTLLEAHKRSSAEDKPILWLVPAKTDSAQQTLRAFRVQK